MKGLAALGRQHRANVVPRLHDYLNGRSRPAATELSGEPEERHQCAGTRKDDGKSRTGNRGFHHGATGRKDGLDHQRPVEGAAVPGPAAGDSEAPAGHQA
jgi:hypothetical protein